MLSSLFQDSRVIPTTTSNRDSSADEKHDSTDKTLQEIEEATDREIADVLLAADIEDEIETIGEDAFEDMFEDGQKIYSNSKEANPNLVMKPKRKIEFKAGLLREILLNKPKRHTFSGLYM